MKKIVSKFLPIALLVLAMSVSSIAVSAAALNPTVNYDGEKVSVSGTAVSAEGGDVVILATRQDGPQERDSLDDAVANIVYVDQASASNINFNFIPKTDVVGNTISVFMGGAGADEVSLNEIATNKVTLYTNGGTVTDDKFVATDETKGEEGDYAYNRTVVVAEETGAVSSEVVTLPTPNKPGYTFVTWCSDSALTTTVSELPTTVANVELYAKYEEVATTASGTGFCAPAVDSDNSKKVGVISVTADFKSIEGVTRFGFVVYRKDGEANAVTIEATEGTLKDDGFYTVVFGIPYEYFNENIVLKPFVATGETDDDVTFGEAKTYSVGEDNANYLGTLEALKAAFDI